MLKQQGILFKFALDTEISPGFFLYGGKKRSDEKAMKAANHELKGLECYWALSDQAIKGNQSPVRLRFALLSIINFRGFCLTAMFLVSSSAHISDK
jgi:hypothetical protein